MMWRDYGNAQKIPQKNCMKRTGIFLSTLLIYATCFAQTAINEFEAKQKEYKADADNEFDTGSGTNIALSQSKVADLEVLGRVWGFLKYYHPAIASGQYNWDYELFRILPKVLNAKDQVDRNSILNSWVLGLGAFETEATPVKIAGEIKLSPDLSWIEPSPLGPELTATLNKVKVATRPAQHYYIGKVPGIGNPEFKNERPYSYFGNPDQGFRLLSLYRYWNIINYFFPYKNLIGEDWDKILAEFIPKFVNADNELDYKLACLALIARVRDTHANIWGNEPALNRFKGFNFSPLEVNFIENKAVVTDYYDKTLGEKTGLKIGDIIESIDGKAVEEIVKAKLPLTPASNYPTQLRNIARDLLRTNNTTLRITHANMSGTMTSLVEAGNPGSINFYAKYQKNDTCFRMISSDIAYLYPGSLKNEYLGEVMKQILKTKGLVIDFRCYPSDFFVFTFGIFIA
jgi:hypothetical protein